MNSVEGYTENTYPLAGGWLTGTINLADYAPEGTIYFRVSARYYNAIKTAYNAGFVNGVSATEFQPEKNTTRAEVSQIIVNYAKKQDEVTRSLSEDIKLIKEKLGLK